MNNLIRKIINREDIEHIITYVLDNIYKNGPTSVTDMEILSFLNLYQQDHFSSYRDSILNYMAVFYKDSSKNTLRDVVFGQYRKYIKDTFDRYYTPVQADIIKGINNNNCFSFSAPTSTGKSFVFMDMIVQTQNDVVVIVPSRALINEYYSKICDLVKDKTVNILTFIDKINTLRAKKSVFIVTPERCRDLFKQKDNFKVDLFLFDEAQLSNEDSKRGLYFDSIVRRCQKAYPDAKFVFAHPFVQNPESQIQKNHFNTENSYAIQYKQKNVGQLFLCIDDNWNFFHFGIDPLIMGKHRMKCGFDPIKQSIIKGGSVLFYISKAKIYKRTFLKEFRKYIDLCKDIQSEQVDFFIDQIKQYTGGDTVVSKNYYSQMIALMKRGIVIHHGSLPLQTRIIIEEFTKAGFCKICFATSTLEQGINMPFDVVFLDRLEKSKPLAVKNLIGRAGRSTEKNEFDYGFVIINSPQNISRFRQVMQQDEVLDNVSSLEKDDSYDDDFNDFKEAILNDTYSDEFNLTQKELEILTTDKIDGIIEAILNSIFENGSLLSFRKISEDEQCKLKLYSDFNAFYSLYLKRPLSDAETYVLNTAIKIILWRVYGKTFKNICWYRYSYVSQTHIRERLARAGKPTKNVLAKFITEFSDIPDKNLKAYSMYPKGTKAKDVDYDRIIYDTYDYIDKLIGFKLSDIFFAAFSKYYEKRNDIRALKLAKYIKYGTDNEKHIWMLRYGLTFEDIDILDKHIDKISSEAIIFKDSINEIPEELKTSVNRFL